MEKVLKWIFGGGGLLLLALALIWGVSKLVGPSRAERAALATMSEPVEYKGRNAYAAIWLLDYPVPIGEMDALMAEDVRRFAATPMSDGEDKMDASAFNTRALQRFPSDAPDAEARGRLCKNREDCLAKVRADLPAYEKMLAAHPAWFARAVVATQGDHLRNRFPPRLDTPLPSFASTYAPATLFAVRFAQGEHEAAIAGTCRALSDWRRLGANSDMLVGWAVAHGYGAMGHGRLLAQMLAETPNEQPLPAECAEAMVIPRAEEIPMCNAMRGEFKFISQGAGLLMQAQEQKNNIQYNIFYDDEMARAAHAVPFSAFCSAQADAAFKADQPLTSIAPPGLYRLQCVSNAIGCILSQIAGPNYTTYELRHRDALAMKRTLAALAWWRAQPDAANDPVATLQKLPPEFRSAAHPLRLNTEQVALLMPALNGERKDITLPLPGTRVTASR